MSDGTNHGPFGRMSFRTDRGARGRPGNAQGFAAFLGRTVGYRREGTAPMSFPARQVPGLRSALAHRMAAGQRGTDLIGERDRQQPPFQGRPCTGPRGHQEPALEDPAAFH